MRILKLNLKQFQGIDKLHLNFQGYSVDIYGTNASGKTTIANAIMWLLTDKPYTGEKNFTPKTFTANGEMHGAEHTAEMLCEISDGSSLTLKKIYREVYTKKRGQSDAVFTGHITECYIDEIAVIASEYAAQVSLLIGDAKQIPLLTRPDYFSEMPWQERRTLLLSITGDVADADVIKRDDALNDLPSLLKKEHGGEYTVEQLLKVSKDSKTEINKKLANVPARMDEVRRSVVSMSSTEKATIALLEKTQSKLDAALLEVSSGSQNAAELSVINAQIAGLEEEQRQLAKRFEREERDKQEAYNSDCEKIRKELSSGLEEIESLRRKIAKNDSDIASMLALRSRIVDEFNGVQKAEFKGSKDCPTCGQALPVETVVEAEANFNRQKSEKLEKINQRGKSECSKEMIEAAQKNKTALEAELAKAELAYYKKQNVSDAVEPFKRRVLSELQEAKELVTKMSELEEKQLALRESGDDTESEAKVDALKRDIELLNKNLADFEANKRAELRLVELEKEQKQLSEQFEQAEYAIYLCELFARCKAELLTDSINKEFGELKFKLFDTQVNGGLVDTCEVLIPSANGELVPYKSANNAARINAGLEIIDRLGEFWQMSLPIIVDNAESVVRLFQTESQLIALKVSEAHESLTLHIVDDAKAAA